MNLVRHTIFRWASFILGGIVSGAALLVGIHWYASRPVPQMGYHDVALGASKGEVLYDLGYPSHVMFDDRSEFCCRRVLSVDNIPSGKGVMDYDDWTWVSKADLPHWMQKLGVKQADPSQVGLPDLHPRFEVTFAKETGRVTEVLCYSTEGGCPPILGIVSGSTEEDVRSRLGKPDLEKLEGVSKLMIYRRYNVVFYLVKRGVYYFGASIAEPRP